MQAETLMQTMSLKDIQALENALKSLRAKAAFLVTLTLQERTTLRYPSAEKLGTLDKALTAARDQPDLMPKRLDYASFERAARMVQSLDRCVTEVEHLNSSLRDTLRTVASDPLKITAEIKDYVSTASRRTPALEDMARRLKRTRRISRAGASSSSAAADAPAAPAKPPTAAPTPAPASTPDRPPQDKAA